MSSQQVIPGVGDCPRPTKRPGLARCSCGRCAVCGYRKHTSLHMHLVDDPGSPPFDHHFEAKKKRRES